MYTLYGTVFGEFMKYSQSPVLAEITENFNTLVESASRQEGTGEIWVELGDDDDTIILSQGMSEGKLWEK